MFNIGAIFELVVGGYFNSTNKMSNAWQFQLASGATPMSWDDVVSNLGEVADQIAADLAPLQVDAWTWSWYRCGTLDGNYVSGELSLPNAQTGDITTSDPLPPQTTFQVAFPTGRSRHILRKAIMGLAEEQTGAFGNFSSTVVTAFNTALAPYLVPVSTSDGTWQMCYSLPGTPGDPYPLYPQAVKGSPYPCVQRRRRV